MHYFIFLTFIPFISSLYVKIYNSYSFNIIKNNIKLCKNCKHFIKNNEYSEEFGKCKLFTKQMYLIDSNTPYYLASISRKYNNMCGKDGKFFEDINSNNNNNNNNNNILQINN